MRQIILPAVLALAALGADPVRAATVIFHDDFTADDQGGNGYTTVTGLTNWVVQFGGNIDILNGGPGWGCANTCIDLDGSTSRALAWLETKSAFSFNAGTKYTLSLTIPTGTESDPFTYGVPGYSASIGAGYPFPQSTTIVFTPVASFSGKIVITNDSQSTNDFGPYLDTVTLTAEAPNTGIVPLPAGVWLLLSGLGVLRAMRRGRQT